jgi:hypothetical protein
MDVADLLRKEIRRDEHRAECSARITEKKANQMYRNETSPETPSERLDALDRQIARMRALNNNHGDMLALRLIEHAETERRQILGQMSAAGRKANESRLG